MVTYERVESWLDGMTTGKHDPKPLASATKNRHVSVIHTAFVEAAKRNPSIRVPSLPHYKEDNVRERYLSPAEERAVLEHFELKVAPGDTAGQYLRSLFLVLLDTGMRCGEALEQMTASSILQRPDGSYAVHLQHGATQERPGTHGAAHRACRGGRERHAGLPPARHVDLAAVGPALEAHRDPGGVPLR